MADEKEKKGGGDLSLKTMLAASTAGAIATAAVSGAGIAGTLLGGAVFPVLLTLAREMVLRAADRAQDAAAPTRPVTVDDSHGRTRAGATPPPGASGPEPAPVDRAPRAPLLSRVRWRAVAVTGGAAVALVVAVYTAGDLVLGESPVADRSSTFFAAPGSGSRTAPDADREPAQPGAPATTTTDPAEPPPATTTAPEEEEPPATDTTATDAAPPEETTPVPAEPPAADPAAAPGPSLEPPATTAPAP